MQRWDVAHGAELCAALLTSAALHVDFAQTTPLVRLLLLAVVHGALPLIVPRVHASAPAAVLAGDWLACSVHIGAAVFVAHWAAANGVYAHALTVPPPLTLALWSALAAIFAFTRKQQQQQQQKQDTALAPMHYALPCVFAVAAPAFDGLHTDPLHVIVATVVVAANGSSSVGVPWLLRTLVAPLVPTVFVLAATAYTMRVAPDQAHIAAAAVPAQPPLPLSSSSSSSSEEDESIERPVRRRFAAYRRRPVLQHALPDAGPVGAVSADALVRRSLLQQQTHR
jgi:hypothetical protein